MNDRDYRERMTNTRKRQASGASSARLTKATKAVVTALMDAVAFEVRSEDELIYELCVAELQRRKRKVPPL